MRETYSDSDDELLALLEAEGEDVVGSPCAERQIAPQAAARAETATQQRQPPPPLPAPAPAQQQRAVSAPAPPAPPQQIRIPTCRNLTSEPRLLRICRLAAPRLERRCCRPCAGRLSDQ